MKDLSLRIIEFVIDLWKESTKLVRDVHCERLIDTLDEYKLPFIFIIYRSKGEWNITCEYGSYDSTQDANIEEKFILAMRSFLDCQVKNGENEFYSNLRNKFNNLLLDYVCVCEKHEPEILIIHNLTDKEIDEQTYYEYSIKHKKDYYEYVKSE
jgi:hypothetical protein